MDKEILYQFIGMDIQQFATFEENYSDKSTEVEISNNFQFSYNFEDRTVKCVTSVIFTQDKAVILKCDLASFFYLERETAESLVKDNIFRAPSELLSQFASLTYGSIRGVIFTKTIGSPLNKIILPPNDIRSVFCD